MPAADSPYEDPRTPDSSLTKLASSLPAPGQLDRPMRHCAPAPYQYATKPPAKLELYHPLAPLFWMFALVFIPVFWIAVTTWFARIIF